MADDFGKQFNDALSDEERKIFESLLMLAERLKEELVREVVEVIDEQNRSGGKLVASGDLRKSIAGDVKQKANEILIEVFPGVRHAIFAHEPTRPHFPPIEPLAAWVRRKGLAGRFSTQSRRRIGSVAQQADEDRQIAFMIARKMARKGTAGVKFMEIALRQATPRIEQISKDFKVVRN